MDEYEVQITLFKNGKEVGEYDALGDSASEALWHATTDFERDYRA